MVTSNIIQRILQLKVLDSISSSFTIEDGKQQYLITAKHSFDHVGYPDSFIVQVFKDSKWKNLNVGIFYHSNDNVDIAVLSFGKGKYITPTPNVSYGLDGVYLSQDCYFLGYPYGLFSPDKGINNGYPLPFIKKACVSAVDFTEDPTIIYLDGYANSGFSGGPAIIEHTDGSIQIFGIVCTIESNYTSIVDYEGIKVFLVDESEEKYIYCNENTGIIRAYAFKHVIEVINSIEQIQL